METETPHKIRASKPPFNFLASLINGNTYHQKNTSNNKNLSFNFLASLINGNDDFASVGYTPLLQQTCNFLASLINVKLTISE